MMSPAVPSARVRRILIVEDEYLVADDLAATLTDLGLEVAGPAPTIEDALAIIENERLDGALIDVNLRGSSSARVAEELERRAIPFVVATGYGELALIDPVLDKAPRVTKPHTAAMLSIALALAMDR